MNILSQLNDFVLKNVGVFMNKYLIEILSAFHNPYSIDSYKQFVEDFDKFTAHLSQDMYMAFLSKIEDEFMNSTARKQLYESKGFIKPKPLLTKFGWIDYKRRRFVNKNTNESFVFLDRFLGLQKYSRMDPFVIGDLCEESSTNSYAKAGKNISNQIGTRIKYDDDVRNKVFISRATVRNNVLKAISIIEEPKSDNYKTNEEINIMLDEKFVGSQFNEGKDHMIKAAVIYEGTKLEYKNRIRLTGKKVFGSVEDDLLTQVVDYIYYNYDTDKLKRINFLGDGALWIKSFSFDSSFKYHKDLIIKFGLDNFHLSQAIQNIVTKKYSDNFGPILKDYVINNKKEDFMSVCNELTKLQPNRVEIINSKVNYILNNWNYIQEAFHNIKFKCSMESNISHVFADIFTSRPKAYSFVGIKGLLKLRLLKINKCDIKKLYFNALIKQEKNINEKKLEEKVITKTDAKYVNYLYHSTLVSKVSNILNNPLYV